MPRPKSSKIWKFFKIVQVNGVDFRKCLISNKCNLLPTPKDGSTSSLINHLKCSGHEEAFKEYENCNAEIDKSSTVQVINI